MPYHLCNHTDRLFSGRFFESATEAALHYQHAACLRAANARQIKRFGPLRCAEMQRDAAKLYAAARSAIESTQRNCLKEATS